MICVAMRIGEPKVRDHRHRTNTPVIEALEHDHEKTCSMLTDPPPQSHQRSCTMRRIPNELHQPRWSPTFSSQLRFTGGWIDLPTTATLAAHMLHQLSIQPVSVVAVGVLSTGGAAYGSCSWSRQAGRLGLLYQFTTTLVAKEALLRNNNNPTAFSRELEGDVLFS